MRDRAGIENARQLFMIALALLRHKRKATRGPSLRAKRSNPGRRQSPRGIAGGLLGPTSIAFVPLDCFASLAMTSLSMSVQFCDGEKLEEKRGAWRL
jgi:hypothetical protein